MDLYEAIESRRSVRAYKSQPVEEDKLLRILEAARLAPSAANRQPWVFYVVRDEAKRAALKEAYGREWFYTAPVIVVACARPAIGWVRMDGKAYLEVDVAIAMQHLILAATAEGLGTCWIGAFDPDAVRRVLELSDDVEPIAMTPVGYPDVTPKPTQRKPLYELVKMI
ncbi:MAG: nitroreductase family protein [Armatimonadota bacterium]